MTECNSQYRAKHNYKSVKAAELVAWQLDYIDEVTNQLAIMKIKKLRSNFIMISMLSTILREKLFPQVSLF